MDENTLKQTQDPAGVPGADPGMELPREDVRAADEVAAKSEDSDPAVTPEVAKEAVQEATPLLISESGSELNSESASELTSEPVSEPQNYTYRWTYGEQRAFDENKRRSSGKRGALVFALTMSLAFLIVLGLLIGVLMFRDRNSDSAAGGGLSTGAVADQVLPSTVLIYSANETKYGYGTGFFVRSNGYIVTNYHVIADAERIAVTLYPSGKSTEAEVVGYSEANDIAVLKIAGSGYPTVKIGNSDAIRVGDVAIAVGNPAGISAPWSTTQGIISSTGRTVTVNGSTSIGEMHMIQTDAPVNPGNSGGPLCNDRAEVIGIVTQKLSDYESLGFAIPINEAMTIVNYLIQNGNTDGLDTDIGRVRPTIGITASSIEEGKSFRYANESFVAPSNGVLVVSVNEGSGADGVLEPGDVIVAIDRQETATLDALSEILYTHRVGDVIVLRIYRRGTSEPVDVSLTLGVSAD